MKPLQVAPLLRWYAVCLVTTMTPNQPSLLQQLVANSALVALTLFLLGEVLSLLVRFLPTALRPPPLWRDGTGGTDLDERRSTVIRHNRRTAPSDRRRNPGYRPLGLYSMMSREQDRRVMARGRRASDWRLPQAS